MHASSHQLMGMAGLTLLLVAGPMPASPVVAEKNAHIVVTGKAYRVTFLRESMNVDLELKRGDGQWLPLAKRTGDILFACFRGNEDHTSIGLRATFATANRDRIVVVGQQAILDAQKGVVLELHYLCAQEGVLVGARLRGPAVARAGGQLWAPPRIRLIPGAWEEYTFWSKGSRCHQGEIAGLAPEPGYAGVSPWEQRGDTVRALDPTVPALVVRSVSRGTAFGIVYLDYSNRWSESHMFLQRHRAGELFLYGGYSPVEESTATRWAWLAPLPPADTAGQAQQVERLVHQGKELIVDFQPIAPPIPDSWLCSLPDFRATLRRDKPVANISDAVVYTVNEFTRSDAELAPARKVGSDVLIRGWFKWAQAPPVESCRDLPVKAHQLGALFGGGITCSALYDGENGLREEQVLDMATRGPAGQLMNAWDHPGIRHGSLSSPRYLDYLFRWSREQIDAGADYLFMDEINAALQHLEGFDDYSLAEFRDYLLHDCSQTKDWKTDDVRWREEFAIDLETDTICADGSMNTFNYRAYLQAKGLLSDPAVSRNPLRLLWSQFRTFRDERAWARLVERIRAYAAARGRTVLVSANGIAKHVDLQVLGVWGRWRTENGHIDLRESQLPSWRSLVEQGHEVAGRRVPVVLFHDWGFGEPPFPWLAVPPSEREIWMRTRGAEIYAAGGFFAFPVLGPFGCNAARDHTLAEIARQTAFYQRYRDLFLTGRYLGFHALTAQDTDLSLALWGRDKPSTLMLHVINRRLHQGQLQRRHDVTINVSFGLVPQKITIVSPDWDGPRPGRLRHAEGSLQICVPELDAYALVLLDYSQPIDVAALKDPVCLIPVCRWARPVRNEFPVRPDGRVEHASDLNGFLQGMLHPHLRNPPTFLVNAAEAGQLLVKVRAVATLGGKLEYLVDGKPVRTVDLPDLDGANNDGAPEYNRVSAFPIPAGQHRITLRNIGGDWATVSSYEFQGKLMPW